MQSPAYKLMSPNLDLLRAIAVSCVFFAHLYETLAGHSFTAMKFGQLGVIMFFVHTSLVLMQSLDRSNLTGGPMVREFLIHRAFRIYPLSVACVLIAFMIPGSSWGLGDLISNLLLTMNLTWSPSMVGGLWSLPLEVQMYLALPLLFVTLGRRPLAWTFAAALVAIPLAMSVPHISYRLSALEYAPCFFGGIIAWRIGRRHMLPGWAFVPAMALAVLPWLLWPENTMWPRWISCIALGLAIPWFKDITTESVNAAAKAVAKYSYGIYLSHVAALRIAFGWADGQPFWIQTSIFIALAVALPLAAFHLIEQPMIRYGKRVAATQSRPKATEPEAVAATN